MKTFGSFVVLTALLTLSSGAGALKVGDTLPKIQLQDAFGKAVTLPAKQWTVIYFYPEVFTGGCTVEAHEYTQLASAFKKANVQVYGVSSDSAAKQVDFVTKEKLNIAMIPDDSGKLGKALEVTKVVSWYNRDTFIISPEGKIMQIKRGVNPKNDAKEALAFISRGGK
jgi:thioredoxin-dependent peroxiredoxin